MVEGLGPNIRPMQVDAEGQRADLLDAFSRLWTVKGQIRSDRCDKELVLSGLFVGLRAVEPITRHSVRRIQIGFSSVLLRQSIRLRQPWSRNIYIYCWLSKARPFSRAQDVLHT